jgi:hypothetical protein
MNYKKQAYIFRKSRKHIDHEVTLRGKHYLLRAMRLF